MKNHLVKLVGATLAAGFLAGCGAPPDTGNTVISSVPPTKISDNFVPSGMDAGVPLEWRKAQAPLDLKLLLASHTFRTRSDNFALHPEEKAYDTKQSMERVFQSTGGFFGPRFVIANTTVRPPVYEDQPYRRLAGVIVGDSVLAIIEMGQGQAPQIIRPGQKIPNSEWTVVSITEEQAVLRRSGNKLPKEITVRLESKPFDNGGGGGTGGGNGGGTPGLAPGNTGGAAPPGSGGGGNE